MEEKSRLAKAYEAVTGEEMPPENRINVGALSALDVALLKQVADEAAKKAVHDAFLIMGMEIDDPIQSQQNFVALREQSKKITDPEAQADEQWVRQTRKRMEGVLGKIILTVVGLSAIGAAQAMWTGFKTYVSSR